MTRDDVIGDGRRPAVWTRPGEGVPLLVIHGGPDVASGYLRHHLPPALPGDVPLVFVDLPGTGRSDPGPDVTPEGMARDLGSLVQELDLEAFVPLGHSFGGLVALTLASLTPGHVCGMVLVDPDPPTRAAWEEALAVLDARRSREERRQLASIEASGAWRSSVDAASRYLRLGLTAHAHDPSVVETMEFDLPESSLADLGDTGARVRRSSGRWDLRRSLGQLRMPTLVISGPGSPYPARFLVELWDALPNGTLKIIRDTAHFPFLEAPVPFRAAVGGFLSSVGARTDGPGT